MKVVQIQFVSWDKKYNFNPNNIELKRGDAVIVETEFGQEIGEVFDFRELSNQELEKIEEEIKPVVRLADSDDLKKMVTEEEKESALDYCRKLVKKYELPMKLVDVHFSLDKNRINFAFYSDNRVDFRNLVKDLSTHFKGIIRLTQIGSRDEAKMSGDYGHCGRGLCCKGFMKDFCSIGSEMAEAQQVSHRGSERVSGMCGKLMCCLSYEYEGYVELSKNLPVVGTRVNVDGRRGEVLGHHILKQSVDVLFKGEKEGENDVVVEVDINRHKKKQ
ncbi:stage 0 sporulation protein [Candidatus Falkowbacteria bacterium HGW-Falkowbacteria-1]|uniref:Stage 0 sporulation protein n=1 Tax=Candidatus Falkowbacteria bacterium HGW-Falkowbacteria-1 TaxID=2013768 RepID=A0A2N2E9M8_9BACT|nr:MAG: stage 0 sporulation protein [Candidatus Falkowbacteria bacterium HGW-Falkowbacteria-1]